MVARKHCSGPSCACATCALQAPLAHSPGDGRVHKEERALDKGRRQQQRPNEGHRRRQCYGAAQATAVGGRVCRPAAAGSRLLLRATRLLRHAASGPRGQQAPGGARTDGGQPRSQAREAARHAHGSGPAGDAGTLPGARAAARTSPTTPCCVRCRRRRPPQSLQATRCRSWLAHRRFDILDTGHPVGTVTPDPREYDRPRPLAVVGVRLRQRCAPTATALASWLLLADAGALSAMIAMPTKNAKRQPACSRSLCLQR